MQPDALPYPQDAIARRARMMRDQRWVQSHIWDIEEQQARELKRLLEAERDRMSSLIINNWRVYGGGPETWSVTDANYGARTEAIMKQISAELERIVNSARGSTLDAMEKSYQGSYFGQAWAIEQGAGVVNLPLLPVEAIRAALLQPYGGLTFIDRFADARDDFVKRIRRSIVQSQISGDGIPQALKRLADSLGLDAGRGGADLGLRYRLEMIARTEILRSSNMAAMRIYKANSDVLRGWEYIATKDERTCKICGPLDGRKFTFRQSRFQPPLHPNCRCSLLPVLIDSGIQDRVAGKRVTYNEWRQRKLLFAQGSLN